jgi:hypothetical protein
LMDTRVKPAYDDLFLSSFRDAHQREPGISK